MRPLFVCIPSVHERNPLHGHEIQDLSPIHEVRCVPGNLIGVGKTLKEAVESLAGLIKWTMEEEPSFEGWYREAWSYADNEDLECFDRVVTRQHRTLKRPQRVVDQTAYDLVAC